MKKLYELSWKVDEDTYRKSSHISYSNISKFYKEGFEKLNSLFDPVSSPSLVFGSAVDMIITSGFDEFKKYYAVADFPKLSDSIINIVNSLYKSYPEIDSLEELSDEVVSEASLVEGYYKDKKWDKLRVKKIREEGSTYFKLLKLAGDKTILDKETYKNIIDCVKALKESNATSECLAPTCPFESDSIEKLYQAKFVGEYNGITIKCMLDLIVVNHKDKTITLCDLKTSSKPEYK